MSKLFLGIILVFSCAGALASHSNNSSVSVEIGSAVQPHIRKMSMREELFYDQMLKLKPAAGKELEQKSNLAEDNEGSRILYRKRSQSVQSSKAVSGHKFSHSPSASMASVNRESEERFHEEMYQSPQERRAKEIEDNKGLPVLPSFPEPPMDLVPVVPQPKKREKKSIKRWLCCGGSSAQVAQE